MVYCGKLMQKLMMPAPSIMRSKGSVIRYVLRGWTLLAIRRLWLGGGQGLFDLEHSRRHVHQSLKSSGCSQGTGIPFKLYATICCFISLMICSWETSMLNKSNLSSPQYSPERGRAMVVLEHRLVVTEHDERQTQILTSWWHRQETVETLFWYQFISILIYFFLRLTRCPPLPLANFFCFKLLIDFFRACRQFSSYSRKTIENLQFAVHIKMFPKNNFLPYHHVLWAL